MKCNNRSRGFLMLTSKSEETILRIHNNTKACPVVIFWALGVDMELLVQSCQNISWQLFGVFPEDSLDAISVRSLDEFTFICHMFFGCNVHKAVGCTLHSFAVRLCVKLTIEGQQQELKALDSR